MENKQLPLETRYLVQIPLVSDFIHKNADGTDPVRNHVAYKTRGPKASLLTVFQSLVPDTDLRSLAFPPLQSPNDFYFGDRLRDHINGRRTFTLNEKRDQTLVVRSYGGDTKLERDIFLFDMLWFLESGHHIIVRA